MFRGGGVWGLRVLGITYLFKDLYKEIIIRNPKKVGSLPLPRKKATSSIIPD